MKVRNLLLAGGMILLMSCISFAERPTVGTSPKLLQPDPTIVDPPGDLSTLLAPSRSLSRAELMQAREDIVDRPFDTYVSPWLIVKAFHQQDAGLLTDVALQLAEGERVLLRERKGISAKQALNLALRAAMEKQDEDALARWAKAAEITKNEELAARIAEADKLAAVTRSEGSGLLIPVDEVDPQQYALLHQCVQTIRLAKLTGDARVLDDIDAHCDGESWAGPYARNMIKKLVADSRSEIDNGGVLDPSLQAFFAKLAAVSRVPVDSDGGYGPDLPSGSTLSNDVTGAP